MLENAVYSVLSPEGFCQHFCGRMPPAATKPAEVMKLTAQDLADAGIVDEVIPEPLGGAQRAHQALFQSIDLELRRQLAALDRMGGKAWQSSVTKIPSDRRNEGSMEGLQLIATGGHCPAVP